MRCFFPAAVTEIIDTWDSTGLRGTASHDYAVADVFVPASHTMWFQEPPAIDRPLYRMPPVAMFATFIGAVPLGIARHALDEFINLADTKTPLLSTSLLADKPVAQDRLGRAHALVAAGRHFLTATLNDLWVRVQAGHRQPWPTEAASGSPPHTPPTAPSKRSACSTPPPERAASTPARHWIDAYATLAPQCNTSAPKNSTSSSSDATSSDETSDPAPGPSITAARSEHRRP